MDEISLREYRDEVASLAQEAADECGYDTDEGREWVWETCDGHQWVIYTFYNHQVLQHSDNDAYSVENFGADSVVSDGNLNTAALAFGALYADVMDAYAALEAPEDDETDDAA